MLASSLLPILLICISYAAAQTPQCDQCFQTWTACYTKNPMSTNCPCYEAYATCLGQHNCAALATSCPTTRLQCPNVVCPNLGPSGIPCIDCSTNFNNCYQGDYTKICGCIPTYENCLTSGSCGTSICNAYKPMCAGLQCAPATGCAKCGTDYSTCITASPSAPCGCLDTMRQCMSDCGLVGNVSDPFGTTCLIYREACPSINCPPLTPCGQCVESYLPCATNAIRAGDFSGAMCTCLDTMLRCLTSTSCINTPYTTLCPFYSPICPNMQCSSRSGAAQQIAGLLDQYRALISEYLQDIFNGTTIQFGVSEQRGSNRVVPITITLPDNQAIRDFLEDLKLKLAEYFKVDVKKLTIVIPDSVKRDQAVSSQLIIEGSGSSQINSGLLTLVVAIVVAIVSMI